MSELYQSRKLHTPAKLGCDDSRARYLPGGSGAEMFASYTVVITVGLLRRSSGIRKA